jgi:hypothetical protein
LPEPVSPTTAVVVPGATVTSTPRRIALSSYANVTSSKRTSPRTDGTPPTPSSTAPSRSATSTSRSRYSKIRWNRASDVWTSIWTDRSDWIGKNSRVWIVVNATSVPSEIEALPPAIASPAKRYASAGMIANDICTDAIRQRPAIRDATSRSASSDDSRSNRSASAGPRPIVLPSRIPLTLSDSSTSALMSAIRPWRAR